MTSPPRKLPWDDEGDGAFARLTLRYLDNMASAEDVRELQLQLRSVQRQREFVQLALYARTLSEAMRPGVFVADAQGNATDDDASGLLAEVLEIERAAQARREEQRMASASTHMEADVWDVEDVSTSPPVRHIVIPRAALYGLVAAFLAVVVGLIWTRDGTESSSGIAPTPVVAATVALHEAVWEGPESLQPGDTMHAGRYRLSRGLAQLAFKGGASVVVEAPAEFVLHDDDEMMLVAGKLVGRCVDGTTLTVTTPSARVRDLGTEFGVLIHPTGRTEMCVFDGEVEITPWAAGQARGSTVRLHQNEAARVDAAGTQVVSLPAMPLAFVREAEMHARIEADAGSIYHRYLAHRYALRRDPALVAYYAFEASPDDPMAVVNRAPATAGELDGRIEQGVERVAGRFPDGAALRFDREGEQYVGIASRSPMDLNGSLTLCAWVRRPAGAQGGHIVALREGDRIVFQLAAFGDAKPTVPGRMGLQFLRFANALYIDDVLRDADDRWQHVAAVDDGTHIHLYLDGELVGSQRVRQRRSHAVAPWRIGHSGEPHDDRSFDGEIDELLVFRRALTPAEIAAAAMLKPSSW